VNKKIVVFIVRRHAGEVDWLLPLLFKFSKNYRIITIFSDRSSFKSLKNNKSIFKIWNNICKDFIIVSKQDSFLWKSLHVIISKLQIKISKEKEKLILNRTFNLDFFIKKFKLNIKQVKCIFLTHSHATYLPLIFKNRYAKIKVIRFPEATMISSSMEENPKIKNYNKIQNVYGDLFLFSSKANMIYFFGNKNKVIKKENLLYCGLLRYERWWINKIVSIQNKKSKKFNILVALRGPNEDYFQIDSYEEVIESIMKTAEAIKNCEVTFKIHPQETDEIMLKERLLKFDKSLWSIKKDHMMLLAVRSNMCISVITSACFDSLALKIPTIEFYNVKKEIEETSKAKTLMHMAYNKKNKTWSSIFSYKGIVQNVYDYKSLERKVLSIYHNKKIEKNYNNKNYLAFQKLVNYMNNSNQLYKIINNKIISEL